MNWFNFFKKKTKESSSNSSKDNDLLNSKEKLGVLLHTGQGNYALVVAPFWNENLLLDEIKSERKISAIIVLNTLQEGHLPLEKLFQIHGIDSTIPIYFSDLNSAEEAFKKHHSMQLPENLKLGLLSIEFQKGKHFIHAAIERTANSAPLTAYIGMDIEYQFPENKRFDLKFNDTWFVGNFDFMNPGKNFDAIIELAPRAKIIIVQFRDWIKANGDKHLEAFGSMGWQGYFMGENEIRKENEII
jgi:hypothetical protein